MSADVCRNCGREVERRYMLCRPCAIAKVRGVPAYLAPCSKYVPGALAHLDRTCAECGYDSAEHKVPAGAFAA